jgi:GNAT superfamily N-acetyltransferase
MAFLRESVYAAHVAEHPAQAEKVVRYLLEHPDGTVLVADVDGTVIGMIGLLVVPHLFSGELTCGEVCWFVDPAHRGSAGLRLLRAAEQWAREAGAVTMQMIAPTARAAALYERLHYTALETNYTKRI